MGVMTPKARTRTGGTASAMALRAILTFARGDGVDIDALLRPTSVRPEHLDDIDHRITEAERCSIWDTLIAMKRDPYLALRYASSVQVGAYDTLDYAISLSGTWGEAIDRVVRFHRVLCDGWGMVKEPDGDLVRFRRTMSTPPAEAEALPAVLVARSRVVTGVALAPVEARFAHPLEVDPQPYVDFFGCPVRHGCAATELVFHARDLALPIASADPGLNQVLERYMSGLLDRLGNGAPLVEHVRQAVMRLMKSGSRPVIRAVARELHLTPRSLQRALGEHATSFSEVVETARRQLGERLVQDGRLSVTEIAFLLGFSDISGFRRAYKAWTGHAPSKARATAHPEGALLTPGPAHS
jgi:AraC-like DNA-binding protein